MTLTSCWINSSYKLFSNCTIYTHWNWKHHII